MTSSSATMLTQISFLLFLLSGFCGLLYQVVWLRLAFSAFGIVTPVLSVVVSVFMLGLALGSWGAGRRVTSWVRRTGLSPIYLYAAAEAAIGVSAFFVPAVFTMGQHWLLSVGQSDSVGYLSDVGAHHCSGAVAALSRHGRDISIDAGIPARRGRPRHAIASVSCTSPTCLARHSARLLTAVVLVELLGFRGTLRVAASVNLVIAAVSVWLGRRYPSVADTSARIIEPQSPARTHAIAVARRRSTR